MVLKYEKKKVQCLLNSLSSNSGLWYMQAVWDGRSLEWFPLWFGQTLRSSFEILSISSSVFMNPMFFCRTKANVWYFSEMFCVVLCTWHADLHWHFFIEFTLGHGSCVFFLFLDRNLKSCHIQSWRKNITFLHFLDLLLPSLASTLSLSHTHIHTHLEIILPDVCVIMHLQKMGVPAGPLPMLGVGLTVSICSWP